MKKEKGRDITPKKINKIEDEMNDLNLKVTNLLGNFKNS